MASSWDDQDEKTHVFDDERAEGVPSGAERWYISPDGKSKEVLTAAEIIERARSGALSDSTLVWRDGLTDWSRLDAVPELMQAVIAFRGSSPATLVRDPAAREPTPSAQAAMRGALPLPPMPGAPIPIRSSTSGPLPPPPALPPIPHAPATPQGPTQGRTSLPSDAQEANTVAISLPVPKAREPQPTLSSVASQAGQLIANSSRDVLERASGWMSRAISFVDRDVRLPEIGVVKGRVLAQIVGGIVLLVVLLVVITSGGEPASSVVATSGSGTRPAETGYEGMDLDAEDVGRPEVKPEQPVSMSDLEPVEPPRSKTSTNGNERAGTGGAAKSAGKPSKEFDVLAAKSALSVAAAKAAACKQGPKGEGSVRVKIAPSGKVVSVTLTTPEFQGTAAGTCVEQVFRQASVPPFTGEDKTVYKKFVIN